MTLAVSNGRLQLDGQNIREVGFNAAYMLARRWYTSTDSQHIETIDYLSGYGVRVIRCVAIPNASGSGGGLGTWGTATGLSASFYTAQDAIFDYAATKGVQIIPVLFGNYWAIANYKSEKCNQLGVQASAMRAYMRTCADEYVAHYKGHTAVAAWEIGNEWNNYAELSAYPSGNDYTGSAYSADSANLITIQNLVDAYVDIASTIKAQDSSRCVISGNAGPWATNRFGLEGYETILSTINPDPIDTLCMHIYSKWDNNAWCRFGFDTMPAIAAHAKRYGDSIGKPLVIGEIGVSSSLDTYGKDAEILRAYLSDKGAAPLTLVWNFYKPGSTSPDSNSNYDIWPGTRQDQLNAVIAGIKKGGPERGAMLERGAVPSAYMLCSGSQCVYTTMPAFGESFTLSMWLREMNSTNDNFPRIVSATSNESTDGFVIIELPLSNTGLKEPYFRVFQTSGQSATSQTTGIRDVTWRHFAYVYTMYSKVVTFDASSDQTSSAAAAGWSTGDPVKFTTTGSLPGELDTTSTFYLIKIDGNTCKLASSSQNAREGTAINLTGAGTGVHTMRCCVLRVYANGLKTGPDYTSFTGTFVPPSSGDFVIGANRNKSGDFCRMHIAKVRVWQRGLNELEVFNDFVGRTPPGHASYLVDGLSGMTAVGSPSWQRGTSRSIVSRSVATRSVGEKAMASNRTATA